MQPPGASRSCTTVPLSWSEWVVGGGRAAAMVVLSSYDS